MIPQADKLIEQAQKGERLKPTERRHCIAYIMSTQPEMNNCAMGELFRVSEAQIRKDRISIREARAKSIKTEDIGLVIADVALSFERQVRDLEKSKAKALIGTRTYLEHCKSIFDIELKKIQALQSLGFYPKSLGNLSVERFEYQAVVYKDGSVETRPVELCVKEDEDGIVEGEFEEVKQIAPPE